MTLTPQKSMLPIGGLRASLIILFDVLMRRRGTVFKPDVFNFLIYNAAIFSLEFLYTFNEKSLAKYSHPVQLFHKPYVCICRIMLDFSFFHNFA
jgi:hypothetical protein